MIVAQHHPRRTEPAAVAVTRLGACPPETWTARGRAEWLRHHAQSGYPPAGKLSPPTLNRTLARSIHSCVRPAARAVCPCSRRRELKSPTGLVFRRPIRFHSRRPDPPIPSDPGNTPMRLSRYFLPILREV